MASPLMEPPRELKDRIMAEVEREATLLGAAGAGADRPQRTERRRRGSWLSGWRLAPVAAALLIAGVLVGTSLSGTGLAHDPRDRRGARRERRGAGRGRPGHARGAEPARPAGAPRLEVWVMPNGSDTPQPTDVLFTPRSDGSAVAAIPGSIDDIQQVLVTDEPYDGGSDVPTGDLLMSAEVS